MMKAAAALFLVAFEPMASCAGRGSMPFRQMAKQQIQLISKQASNFEKSIKSSWSAASTSNSSLVLNERGLFSENLAPLTNRELECAVGQFLCPSEFCCLDGGVCQETGCCSPGTEPCGVEGCYNPGSSVCCPETSSYCTEGNHCEGEGTVCCPNGKNLCGIDGCYNPETESCCAETSTHCEAGYSCMSDGTCCPTGLERCGTNGCYDPDTEVCCGGDGSTSCKIGQDCVDNGQHCCASGLIPCGELHCYNPETSVCCTGEASGEWTCAAGEECCDGQGGGCFIPEDQQCCANGGVCESEETCCDIQCCEKDVATCGSDGFCTATTTATTKTSLSTSTTCSTPTPTRAQTTTETIPFSYNPSRSLVAKAGPSAGAAIQATNEAVLRNMCEGIANYKKALGGSDQGGNTMTLTYGGKCFKKKNRKAMCPRGYCASAVKDYINSVYAGSAPSWASEAITAAGDMSCDEFPFASSIEGGDTVNGVTICVPSADNNWQGWTMSSFFNGKTPKIDKGHTYAIEIQGWDCDKQGPTKRDNIGHSWLRGRDAFSGEGINVTGVEMWRGVDSTDTNLKLMPMPLGDLNAGSYIVSLTFKGTVTNITLVDSNGDNYDVTLDASGSSISFILDDDVDALNLAGTTYDDDAGVVYKATQLSGASAATTTADTTGQATTSNSATATGTTSAAVTAENCQNRASWSSVVAVVLSILLLCI